MWYARNIKTGEHVKVAHALDGDQDWDYVEADTDGWIPWEGGECPLPSGCATQYEVRLFNGRVDRREGCDQTGWGKGTAVRAYRPILDDEERPAAMRRGKTEVETLRLNGWGVGDILEGDEGYGPDRIKITHIGEKRFGCRWDYKCNGDYGEEGFNTTLTCREWKKVGEEKEMSEPKEFEIRYKYAENAKWTPFRIVSQEGGYLFGWADGEAVALRESEWESRAPRTAAQRAGDVLAAILSGEIDVDDETSRAGARVVISAIREGRIPGVKLED